MLIWGDGGLSGKSSETNLTVTGSWHNYQHSNDFMMTEPPAAVASPSAFAVSRPQDGGAGDAEGKTRGTQSPFLSLGSCVSLIPSQN